MTYAEVLLFFTVEVIGASRQVGIRVAPATEMAELDRRIMADHPYAGKVRLSYYSAWAATKWVDAGYETQAKQWLRCIARHEVTHEVLRHAPRDLNEQSKNESAVAPFMLAVWGEKDPICLAYLKENK